MPDPPPFATTAHLNLRGWRDADFARFLAVFNDPRAQRTLNPDYTGPMPEKKARERFLPYYENALLHVTLEAKDGVTAADADAAADAGASANANGAGAGDRDREEDRWVGLCTLQMHISPKNRDAMLGIALRPRWWGRGLGTEAVAWIVDYAFHDLGLHRVSLEVFEGNERAVSLYKSVGFKEEGRRRKALWIDGVWKDHIMMGILEEEWAARRTARGSGKRRAQ